MNEGKIGVASCPSWPPCSLVLLSFRNQTTPSTGHSFLSRMHLTTDAGQHAAFGA
jgi:hypothetical protein